MIRYILFDLDNTLYPLRSGMEDALQRRILDYVRRFLELPLEEARRVRNEGISRHGTTLEWLMHEKGLTDIDRYYAAVHPEGEENDLAIDPDLRPFLERLPVPKAILTNSPKEHSDRILKKLAIADLFTHVFDMRWNGNQGKPLPAAFYRALEVLGSSPAETLFIDDYPRYVKGYIALGGRGILLDEQDANPDFPYPRIRDLRELTAFLDR
ncbi:MAG: HAD-IA family hydrolase [Treponema sp.]|jgi:putative hydrolase of the HAD superfamily|nr:HAD-IA family hydrolase [Treponema sp.]